MKVFHILDHSLPLHSGYTFRSRAIFEQQRALGIETEHLTGPKHAHNTEQAYPEETVEGLRFYRTAPGSGPSASIPVLDQYDVVRALRRRLRELIPQIKPDLLHAHSPALGGVAAVQAGREFGLPVVYEVRGFWEDAAVSHGTSREGGLRYRLTRALESWVLRRADAVMCICEGLRNDISARGIGSSRITVIPNAVNHERFQPIAGRDEALLGDLGLEGSAVLGFIGSFYHYEGLNLLIDALPRLLEARPETRLLLVGGGPMEAGLRAQSTRLGLEDKIIFTGRVPHSEVERYYSVIDLLVYPRLSMRITELVTPLKPLEAMAQTRLFIASDVGGHRELVEDGVTGVLFRAGDAGDLARKALQLLDEPARWPALRAAGLGFVREQRNWGASVSRYLPVYRELIDGH